MRLYFIIVLPAILWFLEGGLRGQVAGTLDASFDPNVTITTNGVFAMAVQPDGKILLGGEFSTVSGQPRGNLARLNTDGTLESTGSFNAGSGANGRVGSIAVRADGRIYIAGDFTSVNGQARNRVALLNADGSLANLSVFDPGTGANGRVRCLIPQIDGRILLAGEFTAVQGATRNRIARLHDNGALESMATFNTGTGANSAVYGAAVLTGGRILLWGDFTTVNGQSRNRIARLSPSGAVESTATFNTGTGANELVFTAAVQPDGRILLGGFFTSINGQTRNHLARLLDNGTLESSATFNPGTGANNSVRTLLVQSDGKIALGGLFTRVNGQSRNRIARLLGDGTLESTATFNPGSGANSNIDGIAAQPDGKVIVAGNFTTVNGQMRNGVARLFTPPVTQSLVAVDNSRVQWTRGGTAAEVEQVTFELSTDGGTNWGQPGAGIRISGGWELSGLNLPASGHLRARGRTSGGYLNGSSGLMESVAPFSLLNPIQLWRLSHFGTSDNTGNAANTADPDKDGLENLVEFAFGRNPNAPDAAALPQWMPDDADYYSMTFTPPAGVSGITYVAEYSTSMAPGSWTPALSVGTPPAYFFLAPAVTSRLYMRVRVTLP